MTFPLGALICIFNTVLKEPDDLRNMLSSGREGAIVAETPFVLRSARLPDWGPSECLARRNCTDPSAGSSQNQDNQHQPVN